MLNIVGLIIAPCGRPTSVCLYLDEVLDLVERILNYMDVLECMNKTCPDATFVTISM
jgi:hypothetical protein